VKYGTSFPQDAVLADPVATRDFAQAVEDLGYDFLTGSDTVFSRSPGAVSREPFVLLGYLAACTKRVGLGTSIVITPQRQTALVAKQVAEIDVLSGGRVHLGIGLGHDEGEFAALNEDYHTRGRRVEEQIAVLRALWTEEQVSFHGRWHQIEGLGISPLPSRRPIPIWMGGSAEAAVRRIARLADGWIPPFGRDGAIGALIEPFLAHVLAAGRHPASIAIKGRLSIVKGTPAGWLKSRDEWQSAGASHFAVSLNQSGFTSIEQHVALLRTFIEAARQ